MRIVKSQAVWSEKIIVKDNGDHLVLSDRNRKNVKKLPFSSSSQNPDNLGLFMLLIYFNFHKNV